MSEKEIISRIKQLIYTLIVNRKYIRVNIEQIKIQEALEGLLDLYNKEKEKNKKLKELLQKKNEYTHDLEKDLFEGCSNYVVRKDEIREIIYPTPENPISIEIQSSEMYKRLEELLEEE